MCSILPSDMDFRTPFLTMPAVRYEDLSHQLLLSTDTTHHIIANRQAFNALNSYCGPPVVTANGKIMPEGVGTVCLRLASPSGRGIKEVRIAKVLYCPSIGLNILSVRRLQDGHIFWDTGRFHLYWEDVEGPDPFAIVDRVNRSTLFALRQANPRRRNRNSALKPTMGLLTPMIKAESPQGQTPLDQMLLDQPQDQPQDQSQDQPQDQSQDQKPLAERLAAKCMAHPILNDPAPNLAALHSPLPSPPTVRLPTPCTPAQHPLDPTPPAQHMLPTLPTWQSQPNPHEPTIDQSTILPTTEMASNQNSIRIKFENGTESPRGYGGL